MKDEEHGELGIEPRHSGGGGRGAEARPVYRAQVRTRGLHCGHPASGPQPRRAASETSTPPRRLRDLNPAETSTLRDPQQRRDPQPLRYLNPPRSSTKPRSSTPPRPQPAEILNPPRPQPRRDLNQAAPPPRPQPRRAAFVTVSPPRLCDLDHGPAVLPRDLDRSSTMPDLVEVWQLWIWLILVVDGVRRRRRHFHIFSFSFFFFFFYKG